MAKKKRDQLSFVGLASALLKNLAQQRSLAKGRQRHAAARQKRSAGPQPKVKKPKDTRTPEQIRTDVNVSRARLVDTVDSIKYDLDIPARARDLHNDLAQRVPAEWRGEPRASIVALSVLVTGLGSIVWGTVAKVRRDG